MKNSYTNNEIIAAAKSLGLCCVRNANTVGIGVNQQDALAIVSHCVDDDGMFIYGEKCFPCYLTGGDYSEYYITLSVAVANKHSQIEQMLDPENYDDDSEDQALEVFESME